MIGQIRKVLTPFYDNKTGRNAFKARPALIIAKADSSDYVILPVSTVTHRANLHPIYDIELDPAIYPLLGLNRVSYVRTHKQAIAHISSIADLIGDIKANYEDLFLEILSKREEFSNEITYQAIY